ncbi:hypothetical protein [Aequorivita sp. CIP111184]|uniref:hypothetical protein n=1 Tax=Aequorivita sp. CIP111184 TaxID=2211356 RepID=UPI000DBBC486|nr:hypothetical protein [Aequorivita sp. CIP111184]SRX52954.1 hypothetical protein AEQU1_00784 [Aequorivita sp. CIP111184]
MKYLLFIIFFISVAGIAQDLNECRSEYPKAVESSEIATKFYGDFAKVNTSSKPVLVAYKGAVSTLKAKFAKSRSDKKEFFKEGISIIESAIVAEPSNIEIHYLRMSVQENSPRFLGYHKNIEEDKQFLLKYYVSTSPKELKEVIKNFILQSENFDIAEKQSIK